jgi:hypothetical protein
VVFLDILGFRSKVKEAGKCATKAVQLESSLEKVHNLGGENFDEGSVTMFSDSVVVSIEANRDKIERLLNDLSKMTWDLMGEGIWMRGGLSVGKLSSNSKLPWGPAFIEAYDTETRLANFPRIVLARSALDFLRQGQTAGPESLNKIGLKRNDDDGVWFVNIIEDNVKRCISNGARSELVNFRNRIDSEYEKTIDDPNVYGKFALLRKEWDRSLAKHDTENAFDECYSSRRDLSGGDFAIGVFTKA